MHSDVLFDPRDRKQLSNKNRHGPAVTEKYSDLGKYRSGLNAGVNLPTYDHRAAERQTGPWGCKCRRPRTV